MKFLKFENVHLFCILTGWSVGKPEYTSCEVYSLHTRCTHSEVELRKCCLGQSEKS